MTDEQRKAIEEAVAEKKAADEKLDQLRVQSDELDAAIDAARQERLNANAKLRGLLSEATGVEHF